MTPLDCSPRLAFPVRIAGTGREQSLPRIEFRVMPNPLLEFTQALWSGGELVLSTNLAPANDDLKSSVHALRTLELQYRQGLPGETPAVSDVSAEWALVGLYRACQFLVYRELPEELLRRDLVRPCPEAPSPVVCYSVDLSFRFLPDLMRLARAASSSDPLVECLKAWAADWPLSSVGILDVTPRSIDAIVDDPTLRTLYVDRILAAQDRSRLTDERVAQAVQTALGGFRELSPAIYDAVNQARSLPQDTQPNQSGVT